MNRCKACGAELKWIKTKTSKAMPCDPKRVTVVTEQGEVLNGYVPHWATCPEADRFRKAADTFKGQEKKGDEEGE